MAVRNLEAIQRQGTMIAESARNALEFKRNNFWNLVNIIRQSREDAIDALDTINALYKNRLGRRFEEWDKNQPIHYSDKEFEIGELFAIIHVSYRPSENAVDFNWHDCGMFEHYSTADYITYNRGVDGEKLLIESVYRRKEYMEKLQLLAENIQPYLNAFFKWVDSL